MKRIILVTLLVFVFGHVCAQNTRNFDCGLFSLDYPSYYQKSPIQNAPHMVLKLEGSSDFVSASYWDKGFTADEDIWDDYYVEMQKHSPVQNGEVVSVTKETLATKGGNVKCLKMLSNTHNQYQGITVNLKMLTYSIIMDEYLLVFTFCSEGSYNYGQSTSREASFMKGLKLKKSM